MGLNTLSGNNSVKEQREELLKLNNDLLYGVYSLINESDNGFELEYLEDVLTCYPNQLENLKGLKDNEDITIVNLGALRKGNIEILSGKNKVINNPVLLSNGVIELVEAKNNDGEIKIHLISTLRDGGAADELQRTTTAGRNSTDDLNEDLEREHIEESPFLGYNKDGNLALATIDNSEESLEILGKSINFFLERKYLKDGDEKFEFAKKNFERNFPGIKYEDLGKLLKDIIKDKRVLTYSTENIERFEGVNDDMKKVSLGNTKGKYFVYFDKANNTIEYRLLRKITGFNDGFRPLSKRPSRLYLESENQYSRVPRLENASNGYVPTIKYFSEKINITLD
ncbi:MAG: hypothetical protein PHH06_02690 [Candidatus Gracilibacteria bacterium]|nr:hypothetical protein [Candidatus Gracilibacteria bacterium]